jgi:hypothetical protein
MNNKSIVETDNPRFDRERRGDVMAKSRKTWKIDVHA